MQTSAAAKRRALVIGSSMAGLFATALLRRAGWEADVFERSPIELFGRGAGIVTHEELLEALELSGASLKDLGITVKERVALGRNGEVIDRVDFEQIVTSWDRLHQIMRSVIPDNHHHLNHDLVSVEQTMSGVSATFANGRVEEADVLIGADGYRSTVRGLYFPDVQPIYAGYIIWRGVAEESELPPSLRETFFEKFAFYLPERNKILGYPIAGSDNDLRKGRRRYNWVWYRPLEASSLPEMLTGNDGHRYELSIPPPKIKRSFIDALRRDAMEFLPSAFSEILACIKQPFFTPIYDHVVPRMAVGRVALIGDAASVARPHVGMGVSKAASDARVLADCLARHDQSPERALLEFHERRLPVAQKAMSRGRDLGAYMLPHDVQPNSGRGVQHVDLHSVRGILEHTASLAFLSPS
jgi:2-polyprenyl-6-methoxyphenol hydroxylase-like FAD-dependent oxidoreductase